MGVATGAEMGVLRIVQTLEETDVEAIARKLGVSARYAESLVNNLVEDGYLELTKGAAYRLTAEGLDVLGPYKMAKGPRYIHA